METESRETEGDKSGKKVEGDSVRVWGSGWREINKRMRWNQSKLVKTGMEGDINKEKKRENVGEDIQ